MMLDLGKSSYCSLDGIARSTKSLRSAAALDDLEGGLILQPGGSGDRCTNVEPPAGFELLPEGFSLNAHKLQSTTAAGGGDLHTEASSPCSASSPAAGVGGHADAGSHKASGARRLQAKNHLGKSAASVETAEAFRAAAE